MAIDPLEPPQVQQPINAADSLDSPRYQKQDRGLFTMPWIVWLNTLWKIINEIIVIINTVIVDTAVSIMDALVPGASQNTANFKGDHLSIRMFGATGDTRTFAVSTTAASAAISSTDASFTAVDIGKRIIIYGADSSGVETQIASTGDAQTSTSSYVVAAAMDAQAATQVKWAANSATNDVTWEVYGSNSAVFAGEVLVHGPENVVALAASVSYLDAAPAYRYYRVKIKDTVGGTHGVAFITGLSLGYVLGTTIAAVGGSGAATLSTPALATRAVCYAVCGTDDTAAIQAALDYAYTRVKTNSSDGGVNLDAPLGNYLFSSPINQYPAVSLTGESGSATIFYADAVSMPASVPQWNMTGTYGSDARIAFFCRLQDVRIDCGHVPGSIGILCDALQENSGLIRVTVIQWQSIGVQSGAGSANWKLDDCWIFPSTSTFLDSAAIGLDVSEAIDTFLTRSTIYAQGGFICGYGTGLLAGNGLAAQGQIRAYMMHFECCEVGVKVQSGGGGIIDGITAQYNVRAAVELNGESPVSVRSVQTLGAFALVDNNSGASYNDSWLAVYNGVNTPERVRGGSSNLTNILDIIPGGFYSGLPAWSFDAYGNFIMGDRRYPNVMALNAVGFSGDTQGGLATVNSRYKGYPNWEKTTNDVSDNALFFVLSGQGIDIRQGPAAQPVYVATGVCNVVGTAVTRTSGTVFSTGWAAGSQIVLAGNVVAFIASVADATHLTLTAPAGTLTGVSYGVSTDTSSFGGASPGHSLMSVYKGDGTKAERMYFDGNFFMGWGNNLDVNRCRWAQTGAAQENVRCQRSTDSGATWTDWLSVDLTTGIVTFAGGIAGGVAPSTATYITQTPDSGLSSEQALSALATGILKSTTATGIVSIATFGDLPGPTTPTNYTPSTSNLSSVSGASGFHEDFGNIVFLIVTVTGTPTSTVTPVQISLPIAPATTAQTFAISMVVGGAQVGGVGTISGSNIVITYANPGAFAPASHVFTVSGFYFK